MVEGVIFDMDGLMVDSEPLAREAWQGCLAPFGQQMDSALYRELIGVGDDRSARRVIERYSLTVAPEELKKEFRRRFLELMASAKPVPGLAGLLEEVARRGYRLGIASNSPTVHAVSTARDLGVAERFTCIVGADQVARPKPAPDVYLRAARGLGLPPTACLAAEDSPSGVQAAQAAGMACVFIPNPDLPSKNGVVADAVYPSLSAWHADLDRLLPRRQA